MPDSFLAPLWQQTVYAELLEEVDPRTQLDRFRPRHVGYTGNLNFWATPSPEPCLSDNLVSRLTQPVPEGSSLLVAANNLAAQIKSQYEEDKILFVAILRAGVPVAQWLTQLVHNSAAVATSLFVGHGIDQASLASIKRDHPDRRIIFVDGWTGKGGVAGELAKLGEGPLAVLSDPWCLADLRGTSEDLLSPSACFTGPTTLGFSRTFTRKPDSIFGTYQFPSSQLNPEIVNAWCVSCKSCETKLDQASGNRIQHETELRVHSNEVCRALINSNPGELYFAGSAAHARDRFSLLLELADAQNVPQKYNVRELSALNTSVACSLELTK